MATAGAAGPRRMGVAMPPTRILVVDDEPLFGELLSGALAAAAEIVTRVRGGGL